MKCYMRTTNTTHSFNRSANKVQKPREAKTKNKKNKSQVKPTAKSQKPTAKSQKPTAKSQKPTAKAKSQKPRGACKWEILAPKCSK